MTRRPPTDSAIRAEPQVGENFKKVKLETLETLAPNSRFNMAVSNSAAKRPADVVNGLVSVWSNAAAGSVYCGKNDSIAALLLNVTEKPLVMFPRINGLM